MIKQCYTSHKRLFRIVSLLVSFLGIFVFSAQTLQAQGYPLPFEDNIWDIFNAEWYSGYTVPGTSTPEDMRYHYSTPIFKYGGNQFMSTIFWEYTEVLQVPQEISINVQGETQTILCEKKFNGIYYNNQRGRRVWPLDQKNLERLQNSPYASGYEDMTVSGGIYTYCSKVNGSYQPGLFDVYGQVDHTLAGVPQPFRLIIGVSYDFTGNHILENTSLAPTLILSKNPVITGYMFDTNGGIAELDLSKHGQCKPGACNLKGEITFLPRGDSIIVNSSLETYYTNKPTVTLQIGSTDNSFYNVTGDFTDSPLTGVFFTSGVFSHIETGITVIKENKWNYISDNYVKYDNEKCTYMDYLKRIYVDTISPTLPNITTPEGSLPTCQNTPNKVAITRTGSYDTGAGLDHYLYQIYNSIGMTTGLVLEGTTTGTLLELNFSEFELGTYYMRVIAVDRVGNISTGSTFMFSLLTQFCPGGIGSGCNPSFQGEISFVPHDGYVMYTPSRGIYYSNVSGVVLQLGATEPNMYVVSGDFIESPFAGLYTGSNVYSDIINSSITLNNINTWNYFNSTYTVNACTYKDAEKKVFVDTLAPTIPTLITPTTGAYVCASTSLPLSRTVANDTGAGLAYYRYEVYNNSSMTMGLMLHGNLPKTTTGINLNVALLPLGTYYVKILAVDNVGNTSESATVNFTLNTSACNHGTGVMIVTPTIWLRNVELDTVYQSDPIWILGVTSPTLLTIDKGMLLLNDEEVGTTGLITSSDNLAIELVSSDEYDETVTSTMSILGLTGVFKLTTKDNDCSLSKSEKLLIENIYEELRDEYNDNISKYGEFLNTFQNMIEDEYELSDSCTLEYFLSLIDDDDDNDEIDTSDHITPNCKTYTISYNYDEEAYYAPQMVQKYYFVNRESLIRHLDYYNPGDCHINTYDTNERDPYDDDPLKHIAPNGKIYHIKESGATYYATEMLVSKSFTSLSSIITYIDSRNPAKEIWTHDIDDSFVPIVYAAPNGKEYKIYKTNRGYMSYKLLRVKYYDTLNSLKAYIDKNNPSKW